MQLAYMLERHIIKQACLKLNNLALVTPCFIRLRACLPISVYYIFMSTCESSLLMVTPWLSITLTKSKLIILYIKHVIVFSLRKYRYFFNKKSGLFLCIFQQRLLYLYVICLHACPKKYQVYSFPITRILLPASTAENESQKMYEIFRNMVGRLNCTFRCL